jgi:hypothetical protein
VIERMYAGETFIDLLHVQEQAFFRCI